MSSEPEGPRAERPKRRRFSADYKLRIVAEYDALTEPGAKGALLRREGLYSTHILDWRLARDHGALQALKPKPPVRKDAKSPAEKEADKLRRENEKLAAELARTKKALAILGKAHELLELLSESEEPSTPPTKPDA
ncbi:transposase-like protein [Streptosporangium lutulentum]|uniref:Transposase-like protein n=1 Tax=Streptosporangium lutulentum TaxID=1461250 RepID=A0ABT9QWF5_9ACTN|nr:transposase-like protein [Streptosporangium lutulentum]